ncbi:hypothetical protein [Roseicyclus mahoneyensis]|jgi:hypothetical protein|uniref:Uncharacterized protein n=1 Tax=Roseicyclus mahoneyensis TaxID=164332 RepID=A0A316GKE3_9RHOB|nr:hypothetical protein [Roseicyclus mahoneyensis]PWK61403.1 hypothetical protein C7455_10289 [Roseicyclus mahoneyensis]
MHLRAVMTFAVVLALSACVTTPREPEPPVLTLDARGIQPTVSQLRIDFGRAQAGVIDTVSRLLDEGPDTITTNAECGAGPVTSASWDDGLTLNFQDGQFVGWTNGDRNLPVAGGFRAGQPRLEMPQVSFQITSLGTEFSRSDVFGLLTEDDAAIRLLWAGTTCFFR